MTPEYQKMHVDERARHHNALIEDGFEWCPQCGEPLIWKVEATCRRWASAGDAPIIAGDWPPLTRDQLAATIPAG